jgi:RNA polymerase sigma-70 factor (ECF subfamily)
VQVVSRLPAPTDDAALIEACRRGERAALERVLLAESAYLSRLLARIVGSPADVEDLLQEVFIAAIEGFARFRGHASVRTWLARIAVKTAMDHFRTPHRRERATLRLVASEGERVEATLDAALDARRTLDRLQHHLSALSDKKRVAVVLHIVEGHSMNEVAALMDASVAATKTRVFLGRRTLLQRVKADRSLCDLLERGTVLAAHEGRMP